MGAPGAITPSQTSTPIDAAPAQAGPDLDPREQYIEDVANAQVQMTRRLIDLASKDGGVQANELRDVALVAIALSLAQLVELETPPEEEEEEEEETAQVEVGVETEASADG